MLQVAVFMSGINNGLDSATPGESRWAQNIAKMLGKRGHQIDCIANSPGHPPSWGNTIPILGVSLLDRPSPVKEYDLVIYTPWEHTYRNNRWEGCLTLPIRSKFFVHNTFSWAASIPGDHTCYNNNHILVYPYIQEDHQFPLDKKENPYPTFPLPLPIFESLAPINIENRKDLIWSTKDVFHTGWGSKDHYVPRIGIATLNAIKKLATKFTFNTRFLSTKYFKPENSFIAKELDINNLVKSIPNSHCYDLVPKDQLMDWMKGTRITTIVSGLMGSFGESIASGSAPLCYSGHIYREGARKNGILLDVTEATEEQIYDCMERLYIDDEFYLQVINDYRHELRYYSYTESYKYFEAMCKTLGLMKG